MKHRNFKRPETSKERRTYGTDPLIQSSQTVASDSCHHTVGGGVDHQGGRKGPQRSMRKIWG